MSNKPANSPFSAVSHSFRPSQSPIDNTHQSMSYQPTAFPLTSPSVALASLSIRTPHRALPASLPPTPKLGPGSSPHTPALTFAAHDQTAPSSPASVRQLQSSYKKMLRRDSTSARRSVGMPPPPAPRELMAEKTLRQEDFWTDVNLFLNDVGNGTPPTVDSHSPVDVPLGPGAGTPQMGEWTEFMDMLGSNPTSPAIQAPLHPPEGFSSFSLFPPADDPAYFPLPGSTPSSAPHSEVVPSPALQHFSIQPSPHIAFPTDLDMQLYDMVSSPVTSKSPYMSVSGPSTSQESNISTTSGVTSSSAPIMTPSSVAKALSPTSSKRPRLSVEAGSGRGRYVSSGSSGAPSPFIGASTKPTGYRRNMTPNDLTPIEAPTQKRNYVIPSVTSRKEAPPSVTKSFHPQPSPSPRGSKRSSLQAGLPTRDESEGRTSGSDEKADPDASDDDDTRALKDHVEAKRRANTIAARKSRRRKVEFITGLQNEISTLTTERDQLQDENNALKLRVHALESQVVQMQLQQQAQLQQQQPQFQPTHMY